MMNETERRALAIRILSMPIAERMRQGLPTGMKEVAAYCGYSYNGILNVRKQIKAMPLREEDEAIEKDDLVKQVQANFLELSKRYPAAGKYLLQSVGEFIEKSEVTHKINGDYIIGIILAAQRELRGEGYTVRGVGAEGSSEMPDECSVLLDEVRLYPERE